MMHGQKNIELNSIHSPYNGFTVYKHDS